MSDIRPGPEGTPLPDEAVVVRLAKTRGLNPEALEEVNAGRAHESMFTLTSADKSAGQRFSVYAEAITQPQRVWELLDSHPDLCLVLRLITARVRLIRYGGGPWERPGLDIEWEPATRLIDGRRVADDRSGTEGHAGIVGLRIDGKAARSRLRVMLSDIAALEKCDFAGRG
jgi:hypothetical protein